MSVLIKVWKGLRFRCPHCGEEPLMAGFLHFREVCGRCGYRYLGESGDFWGQVVFAYTFSGALGMLVGAWLTVAGWGSWSTRVYATAAVVVAGAVASYPVAKALWIHFLYLTRGHYEEYAPPKRKDAAG